MSSDPFDNDDDDDLFNDPSALAAIEAAEQQAIHATQHKSALPTPQPHPQPKKTAYHHEVALPRSQKAGPSRLPQNLKSRAPAPINTEPRAGAGGFGWEHGGKRSMEGNVERHVQNVRDRQEYWANNTGGGIGGFASSQMPRKGRIIGPKVMEEDEPMDVMINSEGVYQVSPPEEALKAGLELERRTEEEDRQIAAAAARRLAIAGALLNDTGLGQRPPLSRSNSASSTSSHRQIQHRPALESTKEDSPFAVSGGRPTPPLPQAPKLNGNRTLARSASMGSHIFSRPTSALAGPSRLPTIPAESSQDHPAHTAFASGSQGSVNGPPASQGSLVRRTALELEEERMRAEEERGKRVKLEEELRKLKEELERTQMSVKGKEKDVNGDGGVDQEDVKQMRQDIWRYKGEAETIRKNQKMMVDQYTIEATTLKKRVAELERERTQREEQVRREIDTMKSQAVFSNNMAHSTKKNRTLMSSQRPNHAGPSSQTQMRGAPTPARGNVNGSPSRRGSVNIEMMTPAPMGKGKAKAKAKQFNQLNNAFATPPAILNPSKRARTDRSPSRPTTTAANITNVNRTPTKNSTPRVASPLSKRDGSPGRDGVGVALVDEPNGAGMEMGMDIDEVGDVTFTAQDAAFGREEEGLEEDEEDQKSLLLHHLFNHFCSARTYLPHSTAPNPEAMESLITQPSLFSIINLPTHLLSKSPNSERRYADTCSRLLQACGDHGGASFEGVLGSVVVCLVDLLACLCGENAVSVRSSETIITLISILSLLNTTIYLFPKATQLIFEENEFTSLILHDITSNILTKEETVREINENILKEVDGRDYSIPEKELWMLVVASGLVDLCEGFCLFGDGRVIWREDKLVNIILDLTASHLPFNIVSRGVDLLFRASCSYTSFRALIAISEIYPTSMANPGEMETSPLVEGMCQLLLSPPQAPSIEKLGLQIRIVQAFCMLVISNPDAVTLVAEKSMLIPALIIVLERESSKIWGVNTVIYSVKSALSLLLPTLSLLHHLTFPSSLSSTPPSKSIKTNLSLSSLPPLSSPVPSQSKDNQNCPSGINLARRLHSISVQREFNGLPHVFVSALGRMAYAELGFGDGGAAMGGGWDEGEGTESVENDDLRSVQFLSQDLLEAVVEGPEGDNIYEIYVEDDDPSSQSQQPQDQASTKRHQVSSQAHKSGGGGGGGGVPAEKEEVDMEVYDAMHDEGDGEIEIVDGP